MIHKVFIVPYDFTPVADNALDHALTAAQLVVDARVYVLHLVNKTKEIEAAEQKLTAVLSSITTTVEVVSSVRVGSIFEEIGEFASEHHAELIFMGTHGISGWQKIAGSNAMKVITGSLVPFVVVQDKKIGLNGYDSIVVPLDLNVETKQKLGYVANIATYFKSHVHIVLPDEKDDYFKRKILVNIKFARKFFEERNINFDVTTLKSTSFEKEVLKYAQTVNADLIAIMNLIGNSIIPGLSTKPEEYLITNDANIPILILNPTKTISSLFN